MQKEVVDQVSLESPYKIKIPATDIFSYVVSSGDSISRKSPQYFDASAPSSNLSLEDAEVMAKRFGKGLQDLGLQKQEKVLLCSPNTLFFPVILWGVTAAGGVFTGCSPTASVYGEILASEHILLREISDMNDYRARVSAT